MIRGALIVSAGLTAVSLSGCITTTAATPPVWTHFDACPDRGTFHEWVTCARQNWQAACEVSRSCPAKPSVAVTYAESLDQSVQRGEITEPTARRKWADFRFDRDTPKSQSGRTAQDRATEAAGASVFCTTKSMGC